MDAGRQDHLGCKSRRARVILASWVLMAIAIATGCASRQFVGVEHSEGVSWPQDQPRIELQTILQLDGSSSGSVSKALRWIGADGQGGRGFFRRPYGIDWIGDDLVICDPDGSSVARISPRGEVALAPGGLFDTPIDVRSCEQGVLVSDSRAGRIAVLDDELNLVRWLAEDLSRPTGIACSDERVFVSETAAHRILIFESDGSRREVGRRGAGPGEFNFPTALDLIGSDLFIADALNFRVQRMETRAGEFVSEFGGLGDAPGETPRMKGIAGDSMGRVWVTDGLLDQIALYSADGEFLFSIGSGDGPIALSFPAGVASHPDGRVAVVDSLNMRLIIFRVLGTKEDRP